MQGVAGVIKIDESMFYHTDNAKGKVLGAVLDPLSQTIDVTE
jgi:hypothetical protein